jgi:2-oxoglutarate dehydrogenase E2 component (dihydrolipoamide succinyltransferase)
MKKEIILPAMGESITNATIGAFLVQNGEAVEEGQEIVEVETDKVNQPLYAPASGAVQWNVSEGDTLDIGAILGHVDTESSRSAPAQEEKKEEAAVKLEPEVPQKEESKKEEPKKEVSPPTRSGQNLRMGKIEFLENLSEPATPTPAPKTSSPPPQKEMTYAAPGEGESREKMSRLRSTIANRLVESLHTSAMLTTFNEVDMSAVMMLRAKYKDKFVEKYGVKLGFMSFFVKAVVEALKKYTSFNAFIDGEEIVQRHYYNVGIAVGTDRGLFVPVLRGTEKMTFAQIEQAILEYAKRAKEGKIRIEDLERGGFTITNGGVYGSLLSTPILNPPQVGILGMHKILNRPIAIGDKVEIRPMMYLALSYDHRLIDGKEAVSFLVTLKEILEDPTQLILFEEG